MPHILVVDDEPFILRSLAFTLRQEQFEVTTAIDGTQALEVLRAAQAGEKTFDLAFLDIMMPGLSGYDVVEQLRQDAELPCPIVFLTAKGMDDDRDRALSLGAHSFIPKPFSPAAIVELVRDICSVAE